MLVLTRDTFKAGSEVVVRFNLSGGAHVEAAARVMHTKPGEQMGIQFVDLPDEARRAIAAYVQEVKPYNRRSVRLVRRISLFLRWQDSEGNLREEVVETRLWSRYGGMVLAEVSLKPGTDVVPAWPENSPRPCLGNPPTTARLRRRGLRPQPRTSLLEPRGR